MTSKPILIKLLVSVIFWTLLTSLAVPLWAQDVVHLQDGKKRSGKIQRLSSQGIVMLEVLPGIGSAQRSIPMDQIRFIDFAPLSGEEEALANPASESMKKRLGELWQEKSVHLQWPTNNAGKIGLTFAEELFKESEPAAFERCIRIYGLIEKEDWDLERRAVAKKGRLRCLIALKRLDEAIAEARQMVTDDDDPALLLEARLVLAQADFERLKLLEQDHPKWTEDKDLVEERTKLYHDVLDQFLNAPLFHGSIEDKAAESLWGAVQVHQFAKEPRLAAEKARDLIELYPGTPQAQLAKPLAAALEPSPSSTTKP